MCTYLYICKKTIMETLTINRFRSNMATTLNKVDNGERIVLRRNSRRYTIVPLEDSDFTITPRLQERINEAERECREGRCVTCSTHEELEKYLESL